MTHSSHTVNIRVQVNLRLSNKQLDNKQELLGEN